MIKLIFSTTALVVSILCSLPTWASSNLVKNLDPYQEAGLCGRSKNKGYLPEVDLKSSPGWCYQSSEKDLESEVGLKGLRLLINKMQPLLPGTMKENLKKHLVNGEISNEGLEIFIVWVIYIKTHNHHVNTE